MYGYVTHRQALWVKKEVGRGLASIQDSVDISRRLFEDYSDQKKHKKHRDQQNNNQKTKKKKEEKQLYGYFKQQTSEISREKTSTWSRKYEKTLRKTGYLLIAAQNNFDAEREPGRSKFINQNGRS